MAIIQKIKEKVTDKLGDKIQMMPVENVEEIATLLDLPYLSSESFDWAKDVEANHVFIRREVDSILKALAANPAFISKSEYGKAQITKNQCVTYFLYGFEYKAKQNCNRCTITTQLIEKIPGMKNAFFYILEPGTHLTIKQHLYKGLVRYHLGVKTPLPFTKCGIKAEGKKRHLKEEQSLIFDNCHAHQLWNNSTEIAAVLCIDVLHPYRFSETFIDEVMSNLHKRSVYVRVAKNNQKAWEEFYKNPVSTLPRTHPSFEFDSDNYEQGFK